MRAILFLLALGACSPYKPDLPAEPFLCGTDTPMCPDGFACMAQGTQMVCVDTTGTAPDGSGGGGNDGSNGNFDCQDDSMLEPNDTVANAFQTPVAGSLPSIKFAGLAICPSGDRDTYKIDITQQDQNLSAVIQFQADGVPLQVIILNSGGATISTSQPVTGDTSMAQTSVMNLPAGTAFVQVAAGAGGGENNYKLDLSVTGP